MRLALTVLLAVLPTTAVAQAAPTGLVDYHVHLMSPDLVRDWKSLGVPFSRPDAHYTRVEPLLGGESSPLAGAVLVPMGHLYGHPEFREALRLDEAAEEQRVARENDYVTAEAARWPGRAVGLCSVPALRSYARREFDRCRQRPGAGGLKLHLATSGVDLRNPGHLTTVAALVGLAADHELPLLVHLDTQQRGTDSTHVEAFLREVLEPHPQLTVVIAHLGGSGGYGRWTRQVARVVQRWLDAGGSGARPSVYLDVSAALLERESEGVPATTDEELAMMAEDLNGRLDLLVFGSDYPVFDPAGSAAAFRRRLSLESRAAEWFGRRLPAFWPAVSGPTRE